MEKLGAFDIGSNAVRLAIGSLGIDGVLDIQKRIRIPLRLGTEAFSTGHFSQFTISQAIHEFSDLKKILEHEGVTRYRAVATSAFRNGDNSPELAKQVFAATGITIEVIDGEEEARLIRKAIQTKIDLSLKDYLLFDIGGGSAELTYLKKGVSQGAISLPMGTVRLLELGKDNPESQERAYLDYLGGLKPKILAFSKEVGMKGRPIRVVGTGGNFKRLSRLRKKILGMNSVRYIMPDEIAEIREVIEETPYLSRMKKFGLRADRADVIVPAIYIIESVMSIIPMKKIIAPDIGLVHGVLFGLAGQELDRVKELHN
jgi:exopolyphosphatase/guanosine-5'-triphosphate,3'-diphosphate pyrophosphatase